MRRKSDFGAPFQTVDNTSRLTGLSRDFIRRGVRAGRIPFIRSGSGGNAPYLIDVPALLARLEAEAAANAGGAD